MGQDDVDADGQTYLAILGMPVLVFEASAHTLRAARERAVRRGLPLAVYLDDIFATGHDAATARSSRQSRGPTWT
ncbi:hypothetical protein BJF80_07340 [Serinicoccus sp. CUA-874]|nr:DUF2000 family protein [Serinicoccus sp. CUA-874]OLT16367.1 hypothetical protein BJF80_07340 [Serinicoccus sp. CUA-874]